MLYYIFNKYRFLFVCCLVLTKIDNYTLLDYSLISSPEITENYMELNLKVTLSSPDSHPGYRQPVFEDQMLYAEGNIATYPLNNLMSFQAIPSGLLIGKGWFGFAQHMTAFFEESIMMTLSLRRGLRQRGRWSSSACIGT